MMMGFGFILLIIFIIILIALGLGLGKLLLSNNTHLSEFFGRSARKTSEEILEERYVKGEINREEFEIMKRDIKE